MELEQLHEAGSSQVEQRTAAEKTIADVTAQLKGLEAAVHEKKGLFEEAEGEGAPPREGEGVGLPQSVVGACLYRGRREGAWFHSHLGPHVCTRAMSCVCTSCVF